MALTDVSFLFAWLVAIGIGQRFVEHPRLSRAVALGVAVGLAQYFKYNGWLTGVATALAVLLGIILDPPERRARDASCGWPGSGAVAALVAALVYGPWFRFVEANGGYAGLLAHQRGYMGGLSSWVPHWSSQMAQGVALSGGPAWGAFAMLLACAGVWFASPRIGGIPGMAKFGAVAVLAAGLLAFVPMVSWWVALGWVLGPWAPRPVAARVLGAWWLLLAVLTPFYHPYARLWLPLHAASWIIMGGVVASLVPVISRTDGALRLSPIPRRVSWQIGLVAAIAIGHQILDTPRPRPLAGLLGPSDSVRAACQDLVRASSPPRSRAFDSSRVRRSGSISRSRGGGRSGPSPICALCSGAPDPASWVVVDEVLLRQEGDASVARRRLMESL